MVGLVKNILALARSNTFFRQVLETGEYAQIVIMSIPHQGEIGEEVHTDNDQILCLVEGKGEVILNGESAAFVSGDIVLVRSGTKHNIVNKGLTDLKIISIYSPPHHLEGTVHKTRLDADKSSV